MIVIVSHYCAYTCRYCAYNIGDTSAVDDLVGIRLAMGHTDTVLDELIQKTRERQAGSLHEVTWRGRVLPIKNDKVCPYNTLYFDLFSNASRLVAVVDISSLNTAKSLFFVITCRLQF